ncbi:tetratricopeptide repeat protein [Flavisphingomonas formosensis]|uniref:tetratricopeptide repeat protein n=1 Tax=Flavisphingomonas formosensis TaxID=861534 RepID=UPI0018DF3431|nr:hypothetical protein [Sphingomonas formosensis]
MIPFLLFLADAPAAAGAAAIVKQTPEQTRYDACVRRVKEDPRQAATEADAWRIAGGGLHARQCLGLAYVAQGQWSAAAIAFEQAAREAQSQRDGRAATLWAQAGNAALAGDDPAKARDDLTAAIGIAGGMSSQMLGEAHLDRARAGVALNDTASARGDINEALKLVPQDGLAWLLSATLARRMNDTSRAAADIEEALRLAPEDPSVALEAGNIAAIQGAAEAARVAWQQASAADPSGPVGDAARAALAQAPAAAPARPFQVPAAPAPAAAKSTDTGR